MLLTVYMDVYVANNLLDGDASQLIAKGWLIKEQGNLFTDDLYLTTEVRFFDTSAIAAFFFLFFNDWTIVRILTTITLQAWYVLGFLFLCRQSGVKLPQAITSAGMLMLPISIPYARCVLYHLYYLQYCADVYWIMGLTVYSLIVPKGNKCRSTQALICLWWFYAGTIGIRYMLIIGVPMLAYTVYVCLRKLDRYQWRNGEIHGEEPFMRTDEFGLLRIMIVGCICFAVGFMINVLIVAPTYSVNPTSSWYLPYNSVNQYSNIFAGLMIAAGVRDTAMDLVSLRGVSLIAALIIIGWSICYSSRVVFSRKERQKLIAIHFPQGMLFFSLVTTTLVFMFDSVYRLYELYYVPVISLIFLVVAYGISRFSEKTESVAWKLMTLVVCLCILFQGAYSLLYLRVEKNEMDAWGGLSYREMDTVDQVRDCVDFMQQNGYTHGLISYWCANTMIEMTDGELNMIGLRLKYDEEFPIKMQRWGSVRSAFSEENLPEKVIIFVHRGDADQFEENIDVGNPVHEGWIFNGYEVDSALIR